MNNFVYLILTIVPDCKLKDHLHRFYLYLVFTDSTEIFFSKLGSAGLNYYLPKLSFITDPYCAGGI